MPIKAVKRTPDLGKKRSCTECQARFYDFGKAEPTCPKCGTVLGPEVEVELSIPRTPKPAVRAEDDDVRRSRLLAGLDDDDARMADEDDEDLLDVEVELDDDDAGDDDAGDDDDDAFADEPEADDDDDR